MCGGSRKVHTTFRKVPVERQGNTPGYLLSSNNPELRLSRRDRSHYDREAKHLGLGLKFDCLEAPDAFVFVTDLGPTKKHKGPFDERVAHFASHIAPGGEERTDTVLAHMQLAAFATA